VFDLESGEVLSKFETLINPMRNVPENSTEIHQLTAAHLSMAPTFEEFGPWLAHLLGGKRVLAHNALFDVNFLNSEFSRSGIDFKITEFDCTQKLFKSAGLAATAESFDIDFEGDQLHGASYDAQLCFEVFLKGRETIQNNIPTSLNASYVFPGEAKTPSLITRQQLGIGYQQVNKENPNFFQAQLNIDNPVEACYLWRLADYLSDLQITQSEKAELDYLAADLEISVEEQLALHTRYVRELEKAAMRDGLITEAEKALLEAFADALEVPLEVNLSQARTEIPPKGSLICVTGTTYINGDHWGKAEISSFLSEHGYQFTDVLSKSANVALLLQESEGSQSSKVDKARKWGIPRLTIDSFVQHHTV
jgi:DNA polymerase-3 subunit epsilon